MLFFKPPRICTISTLKNIYHEKLQKNYIEKGTQVENLDIVKVTIRVEELLQHKHELKGKIM